MGVRLKPIKKQVMVITGASSGIGLSTAKLAARKGARVVLSSRNGPDLKRAVEEIEADGGEAIYVVADVSDPAAVDHISERAIQAFGGFDTWVNNAGVSAYGKLTELHLEEKRRIFDVNFWGYIHGCRAAVKHLRDKGGAIINIGSVVSERAIPLQGIYSATKHAIKAYTDTLRMELEKDGFPISVTLIKPASIDTPYVDQAANMMEEHPDYAGPVYAPELCAKAIVRAASHPFRDINVGGASRMIEVLGHLAPRFTDRYMELTMFGGQKGRDADKRRPGVDDNLYSPPPREGKIHGSRGKHRRVKNTSLYTSLVLHPLLRRSLLGLGVVMLYQGYRGLATGRSLTIRRFPSLLEGLSMLRPTRVDEEPPKDIGAAA